MKIILIKGGVKSVTNVSDDCNLEISIYFLRDENKIWAFTLFLFFSFFF